VKHLSILVDGRAWFDGNVAEISITDNERSITVTGKISAGGGSASAGPSFAERLARAAASNMLKPPEGMKLPSPEVPEPFVPEVIDE